MKVAVAALIPLLLGLALGVGGSVYELNRYGDHFDSEFDIQDLTGDVDRPASLKGGKIEVVGGATHDFGVLDRFSTGNHTFVLKNVGTGPLIVKLVTTSCKCTSTSIEEGKANTLQPNETIDVPLEWTVKGDTPNFRQTATFETSDPELRGLDLIIQGRVEQAIQLIPNELVFTDLPTAGGVTKELKVFAFKTDDLRITKTKLEEGTTASQFEVTNRPLTDEELKENPGAKSGFVISVTPKPGFQIGSFRQIVNVQTSSASAPEIEFGISGNVTGQVLVKGTGYFPKSELLKVGVVGRGEARRINLQLFVRGEVSQEVEVSVDQQQSDPQAVLSAHIGEPTALGKQAMLYPLTVIIDGSKGVVNRLGSSEQTPYGRIVIRTTHPDAKEIAVKVSFATEG